MLAWVDELLQWLKDSVMYLLLLLPESPLSSFQGEGLENFTTIIGYINYFVPIGAMVTIYSAYLAAVAVWYTVRWFLRLAQYID